MVGARARTVPWGRGHHGALGTPVRMHLLVPARQAGQASLCHLAAALPRVGASDGASLGDMCTCWVPAVGGAGGHSGFLSASVTGGLPSHWCSPVDVEMRRWTQWQVKSPRPSLRKTQKPARGSRVGGRAAPSTWLLVVE